MKKLYELICAMEAQIARAFLIVMVILIFSAGFARLAGHPINWAIDVSTCVFAWACFLSADVAWRKNRMMSVEVFTNRLSPTYRKYCRMATYAILMIFLTYVVPTGIWLSYVSRERSFQGIPDFSYSWVTMSMPVGALLLMITTILKVREEVKKGWASTPS